jgi:hypothetical protein
MMSGRAARCRLAVVPTGRARQGQRSAVQGAGLASSPARRPPGDRRLARSVGQSEVLECLRTWGETRDGREMK